VSAPCSCRGCTETYNAALDDVRESIKADWRDQCSAFVNPDECESCRRYEDVLTLVEGLRRKHLTGADIINDMKTTRILKKA
jgi:hypothetical protein